MSCELSCAGRGQRPSRPERCGLVLCTTSVWASQLLPGFQIHGTKGNCVFFRTCCAFQVWKHGFSMLCPHFPLHFGWSVYCGNIFLVASPTPLAYVYFPICDGIQMMLVSERNTFPGYGFCCLFLPASKTRQHLNPEDLRGIEEIDKGQREWLWTVKVK